MRVDDGPNQDSTKGTWDLYDDDGRLITTLAQLRASVLDSSDATLKNMLTLPVAAAMPAGLRAELEAL